MASAGASRCFDIFRSLYGNPASRMQVASTTREAVPRPTALPEARTEVPWRLQPNASPVSCGRGGMLARLKSIPAARITEARGPQLQRLVGQRALVVGMSAHGEGVSGRKSNLPTPWINTNEIS